MAVVFVAVFLTGGLAAGAGDDSPWSDPEMLDPEEHELVRVPTVDLGTDGYAVAGWDRGYVPNEFDDAGARRGHEPLRSVVAVRLPSEEGFSDPGRVAPGRTTALEFGITEDEGAAVLAWHREGTGIQVRTHSPETGWSEVETVAEDAKPTFDFDLASDGSAVLAWRQGGQARLSFREPGGNFSEPEEAPMRNVWELSAASDGGVALASGRSRITASVREPGGASFSEPQEIPGIDGIVSYPRLQIAADGTTAVLGDVEDSGKFEILASVRPPGGEFGSPEAITGSKTGAFAEVDADSSGRIVAVWTRHARFGRTVSPRVSVLEGEVWSEPGFVAARTSGISSIDVAPSGRSIVGVEGLDSRRFSDALASTSDESIAFTGAEEIAAHQGDNALVQHDVAINDSGEAVSVWATSDDGVSRVMVSTRPPG